MAKTKKQLTYQEQREKLELEHKKAVEPYEAARKLYQEKLAAINKAEQRAKVQFVYDNVAVFIAAAELTGNASSLENLFELQQAGVDLWSAENEGAVYFSIDFS